MIVEQHAYPIFDQDWGADEELLLIEGAETQGLGSWQDIADHIGGRSKQEVEDHYSSIYLESEYYPLPNMNKRFNISAAEFAERKRQRLEKRKNEVQVLPIPKQKPTASVPACHEVQGYMPGRLEFEQEHENDAEGPVKDMVFDPEDPEGDVGIKLTILDIYSSRLTNRSERKRTIIEHNMVDYRKNNAIEKKRPKDEKDLLNKIRPFARVMTRKDYQDFQDSILTEFYTRRRIAELQEYRRNGIRTLEGAQKYERDKSTRINALVRIGAMPQQFLLPASRHPIDSIEWASEPVNEQPGKVDDDNNEKERDKETNGVLNGNSYKGKPVSNPLDVSNAPDFNLLTVDERTLCSQLRINPKPYLAIKETLFRELLRSGGVLRRKTAKELLKIDGNKINRIYDFFITQNWIA